MTVNGSNDDPEITTITAKSATEDGAEVSGTITATDIDADDSVSFSAPATDGFSMQADGTYSFDPSIASLQELAAGETRAISIPITATDQHGASDSQNLVITVTGTNDTPTVSGAVTLPGVGKIYCRERPERMVRNPATGEQIKKEADKVVKMTIAKALKDSVNG